MAAPEPLANTESVKSAQATIEDKLNDFLHTLKIHNKDLDACFNDALAVRHLKRLITTETTKARIDEHQVLLDLIPNDVTYASEVIRPMRDRFAALQKEQNQ